MCSSTGFSAARVAVTNSVPVVNRRPSLWRTTDASVFATWRPVMRQKTKLQDEPDPATLKARREEAQRANQEYLKTLYAEARARVRLIYGIQCKASSTAA